MFDFPCVAAPLSAPVRIEMKRARLISIIRLWLLILRLLLIRRLLILLRRLIILRRSLRRNDIFCRRRHLKSARAAKFRVWQKRCIAFRAICHTFTPFDFSTIIRLAVSAFSAKSIKETSSLLTTKFFCQHSTTFFQQSPSKTSGRRSIT